MSQYDEDDFPVNDAQQDGDSIRSSPGLSRRARHRPESRNSRKGPRDGETEEEYRERKRRRREERRKKKEELMKQGLIEDDPERRKRRERRKTKVASFDADEDAQKEPREEPDTAAPTERRKSRRSSSRAEGTQSRKRREPPTSIQIPGNDSSRVESFVVEEHDRSPSPERPGRVILSPSHDRRSPSARKDADPEARRRRREEREARRRARHGATPDILESEEPPADFISPKAEARNRRKKKREQVENILSSPSENKLPEGAPTFNIPSQEDLDAPITQEDLRRKTPKRSSRRRKSENLVEDMAGDDKDDADLGRSALESPPIEEGTERWGTVREHRNRTTDSDDEQQRGSDEDVEGGETRIRNATTETDLLRPVDTDQGVLAMTRKIDNMLHFFSFTNPNSKPPQKSQKHSKFTSDVENRLTREIRKAVLNITVHHCDMLRLNTDVIHPVVRITAIDSQTGTLLPKHDISRSAVSTKEYVGPEEVCEYVLPVMVKPYDMRRMKSLIPQWESSLFYDQDYDYFLNPNVVFIFEIMEFDTRDPTRYASTDGMKKIAWAYLHPLSESGRSNTEKRIRLQLYHYPKNLLQKVLPSFLKKADPLAVHTDNAFPYTDLANLYNLKSKKKYPSTLHVILNAYERPIEEKVTHRPQHQLQREVGAMTYEEMYRMYGSYWSTEDENIEEVFNEQENRKLNLMMTNLKRVEKEKCKIPDHLLFQLESGSNGCLCVAFSHNNEFIACACSNLNSTSTIKVYHVFTGKLAAEFEGHLSSLVYDIDWNQKDNLLCSASGDSTVRIWNFGKKKQQLFNIQHPSFVYAAKFHPTFSTYVNGANLEVDHLLVTGSYDHKIRFFVFSSHADFQPVIIKELDLHSARVNSLTFDPNGLRLFSGDGSGVVNIMSARIDTLAKHGRQEETAASRRSSDSSVLINEGTPLRGYTTDISLLRQSVNSATMEQLSAWKNSDTLFTCIKTIKERDITRSNLTTMRIDPRHPENRLIVHSQDNLIRLLDLNNNVVLRRYSGVKCHINAQKSQVSPDGRYVISGSDTGKVYIWYKDSEKLLFPDGLDFGFMNHPVYDIAWATDYHIVALCSYGTPEPIRLFTIEQEGDEDIPQSAPKTNTANIAKKFLGTLALGGKGGDNKTMLKVPLPSVIPKSPRRSPRGDLRSPRGDIMMQSPSGESLRVG